MNPYTKMMLMTYDADKEEPPEEKRMGVIGFEREEYKHSEMHHGEASSEEMFDMEVARAWTHSMHNEDGSKGAHWTLDQVKQVLAQRGIKHDPVLFWAVLNSIYSDYCAVFKKHGVSNMDFYVDMANAWINDKDSVKNKALEYYEYIVRH